MAEKIIDRLPAVRGRYRENSDLSKSNWFRVGGRASVQFKPADIADLADFIRNKPQDIEHLVIGAGSNIIIRDGGFRGVVIRLGREFATQEIASGTLETVDNQDKILQLGAANLNANIAIYCVENNIAGLEFLSGIPGTIGGALAMNAGAYGEETSGVLISATAITDKGEIVEITAEAMGFTYRHNAIDTSWIFIAGTFRFTTGKAAKIQARIDEISAKRNATQPVRTQTGGSTFQNPDGHSAWKLIDDAGCRGLKIGDAQMSELHCNFMNNLGNATASDLEELGDMVINRVYENSGIKLEWEIKRIGEAVALGEAVAEK